MRMKMACAPVGRAGAERHGGAPSRSWQLDDAPRTSCFVTTWRDGSVGAASLGARRDAPSPKRAPSVRSDERPLATQGDMLNSIKFQRRLRDTLLAENRVPLIQDKINPTANQKTVVTKVNSKSSTGTRGTQELSTPKEKTSTSRNVARPISPKGRRNTQYH